MGVAGELCVGGGGGAAVVVRAAEATRVKCSVMERCLGGGSGGTIAAVAARFSGGVEEVREGERKKTR